MMAEKIRIGLIGGGAIARQRHLPGFQRLENVEVACVCNRSKESSEATAKEYGIPRIAYNWQEVVQDPELEAVCIGAWPYLHAEATIKALEAGKHVFTQARMARNLSEAEAMMAASKAHPDLVCQIAPSPFTLQYDETVQALLQNGILGEPQEVIIVWANGSNADSSTPMSWRQDYMVSGCNIHMMGVYHEVILRWLDADPQWLSASGNIFTPERPHPEKEQPQTVEIPDTVHIHGKLANDALFQYRFSTVEAGQGSNEIRINGSLACLRVDVASGSLYLTDNQSGKTQELDYPELPDGGWRAEEAFVESIRHGSPVEHTSFATGLRYMKFTELAWRSWQHGGKQFTW